MDNQKQQQPIIQEITTKKLLDLKDYDHAQLFESTLYPWQALKHLPEYITKIIQQVPQQQKIKATFLGSVYHQKDVLMGQGTVVEHGAMIKGPAIIGKNCQIRKGAYIRGNAIIGDQSIIGNSTQIKHSIVMEKAEICHFNYVGDSVVAKKAHMAAGAITSNLKLDSSAVTVKVQNSKIQTKMMKFGAFLGQSCQIGCNTVLNPGSIVGKFSIIYPCVSFRGYLPPNKILKLNQSHEMVERR